MRADGSSGSAGANEPVTGSDEALTRAFRHATQQLTEIAPGTLALAFVLAGPDAPPRLRSAAGFQNADEARRIAASIQDGLAATVRGGHARSAAAPDGCGSDPKVLAMAPIQSSHGVPLGVLAMLSAEGGTDALSRLSLIADLAAARLERARLSAEVEHLRLDVAERHVPASEPSDELLALSETVFAQDLELLRNRETIGKIERLKNDFIEKMSRELRTPLTSIIESIISVLANDHESLSESAKGALRTALDEGTSFLRTLQNILDLWRLRQSEMPIEIHDASFRDVVDESIFSVQDTLGDKPVVIEKHLTEPLPKIRTDLAKLSQILFLLLDNAAKFTPKGRIDIRARVRDGTLFCELEDTGIGICPDDQTLVFDEFFQVEAGASGRYRGAGLGLTLVRELITLLGGNLSLNSEVGRGTTVRFELPVQVVS